jgi:Zn-dependent M28 family amino/carboxypeptidase
MSFDNSIPGYPELLDWPRAPVPPIQIANCGRYRDGGPQGGTYYVDLVDAEGNRFAFFFDRFLGRLCYGSATESGHDAAFLRRGSRIEQEAIALIEELALDAPQFLELLVRIRHATEWTASA